MKSSCKQTTRVLALITLLCFIGAAASVLRALQAQDESNRARSTSQTVIALADEIQQITELSPKQPTGRTNQMGALSLSQTTEQVVISMGLPADTLDRVTPEPKQAIKDSPYAIEPTTLTLRRFPLNQLPTFFAKFQQYHPEHDFHVSRIRLIAPRNSDRINTSHEAWDIETTVTRKVQNTPQTNDTNQS